MQKKKKQMNSAQETSGRFIVIAGENEKGEMRIYKARLIAPGAGHLKPENAIVIKK